MSNASDEIKKIYDQDCQFYRYQDDKMWSRFQTAALVEGGMLYALYQHQFLLPRPERIVLAFCGSLIVFIICLLALKDQKDGSAHLDRLKGFEDQFNEFIPRKWPKFLRGVVLLWTMGSIVLTLPSECVSLNRPGFED
jgi:hypothetical protein